MPEIGKQTARVVNHYVRVDDKGQLYVNFKFSFEDGASLFSRVYVTEKSAGIARASLKLAGFEMKSEDDLFQLDQDNELLAGTEVPVEVTQNGQYLNCQIDVPKLRAPKSAIAKAAGFLMSAKRASDGDATGGEPDDTDLPF